VVLMRSVGSRNGKLLCGYIAYITNQTQNQGMGVTGFLLLCGRIWGNPSGSLLGSQGPLRQGLEAPP